MWKGLGRQFGGIENRRRGIIRRRIRRRIRIRISIRKSDEEISDLRVGFLYVRVVGTEVGGPQGGPGVQVEEERVAKRSLEF